MPEREREAVVWCPRCREAKFEIWRVPLDDAGHFAHMTEPQNLTAEQRKYCLCGAVLERK